MSEVKYGHFKVNTPQGQGYITIAMLRPDKGKRTHHASFAFCSPREKNFRKKFARHVAESRLNKGMTKIKDFMKKNRANMAKMMAFEPPYCKAGVVAFDFDGSVSQALAKALEHFIDYTDMKWGQNRPVRAELPSNHQPPVILPVWVAKAVSKQGNVTLGMRQRKPEAKTEPEKQAV